MKRANRRIRGELLSSPLEPRWLPFIPSNDNNKSAVASVQLVNSCNDGAPRSPSSGSHPQKEPSRGDITTTHTNRSRRAGGGPHRDAAVSGWPSFGLGGLEIWPERKHTRQPTPSADCHSKRPSESEMDGSSSCGRARDERDDWATFDMIMAEVCLQKDQAGVVASRVLG